jgi:hypothetical protein
MGGVLPLGRECLAVGAEGTVRFEMECGRHLVTVGGRPSRERLEVLADR